MSAKTEQLEVKVKGLEKRIRDQHNNMEVLKSAYTAAKKQVKELQEYIKTELARNNSKPQN